VWISFPAYGFADLFRGELQDKRTLWLGDPFQLWLDKRGISLEKVGLNPLMDIQSAEIFPVVEIPSAKFIQWLISEDPQESGEWKNLWINSRRMSARFISQNADLKDIYSRKMKHRQKALPLMASHAEQSILYNIDLETTALEYAESSYSLPEKMELSELRNPEIALHNRMFRSAVLKHRNNGGWREAEKEASRSNITWASFLLKSLCCQFLSRSS